MSDLNKGILKMTFELKTMIGRVHSHLLPKDFFLCTMQYRHIRGIALHFIILFIHF